VLRIKKQMWFKFLCVFCLSFILFGFFFQSPCECKQWLECQTSCEKHDFRMGGLEVLDKISLNDVYERLLLIVIQYNELLHVSNIKFILHENQEPRVLTKYQNRKNTLKTTECCHTCIQVTSIKT